MPPAEFEPAIPATERPQIYALDREATKSEKCSFSYNSVYYNDLPYCKGQAVHLLPQPPRNVNIL